MLTFLETASWQVQNFCCCCGITTKGSKTVDALDEPTARGTSFFNHAWALGPLFCSPVEEPSICCCCPILDSSSQ